MPRRRAMAAFLAGCGWGGAVPEPLAGDASFRTYYRVRDQGRRAVVMDAPPPQEDVAPFVAVAALLRDLGFSAPEVLAEDREQGFLLLEDLGDDTYTRLLDRGADEESLYALAVDTLAALQGAVATRGIFGETTRARGWPQLPPFVEARLLAEAVLLVDWYMPAVHDAPLPAAARDEYLALWRLVLPQAVLPFSTLVLRDYHVDNLMRLPERPGVRGCGLLDFQDAVRGPPSYDLVSLLEDARRDVPAGLRRDMTERYLAAFPACDRALFARSAAILAALRNSKIRGIFSRLARRDGKPLYLVHIPRVWRLLAEDLGHPALAPLARWFDRRLPPEQRTLPALRSGA